MRKQQIDKILICIWYSSEVVFGYDLYNLMVLLLWRVYFDQLQQFWKAKYVHLGYCVLSKVINLIQPRVFFLKGHYSEYYLQQNYLQSLSINVSISILQNLKLEFILIWVLVLSYKSVDIHPFSTQLAQATAKTTTETDIVGDSGPKVFRLQIKQIVHVC
jgi:hypothetical protein